MIGVPHVFPGILSPDVRGKIEPVGFQFFNRTLNYPVSAHPRIDHNGDLLFHSYSVNGESLHMQHWIFHDTMHNLVYSFIEKSLIMFFHLLD